MVLVVSLIQICVSDVHTYVYPSLIDRQSYNSIDLILGSDGYNRYLTPLFTLVISLPFTMVTMIVCKYCMV
jgi:hypothetical protein